MTLNICQNHNEKNYRTSFVSLLSTNKHCFRKLKKLVFSPENKN